MDDFTNTFVLSSVPNLEPLFEIPKAWNFDPARRRRAHQKSRTGCDNCRKRRVKCGQGVPCENCSRRGERCEPSSKSNWAPVQTATPRSIMPTRSLLPRMASTNTAVDPEHLKLFHHFQTYTQQTLLLGPDVWSHALQMSFQFDFLMSAILCIAARHLAVLRPQEPTYPTVATNHLCRSLSRFRIAISKNLTSTHVDAFIATSLLLQYELWTNADIKPPSKDAGEFSDHQPNDHLFTFCSSLKEVFLKGLSAKSGQNSVFLPQLRQNPRDALVRAARVSCDTIEQCQKFFSWDRSISPGSLELSFPYKRSLDSVISNVWQSHIPRLSKDTTNPVEDGYVPVVTQLCLILSFLPEAQPPELIDINSSILSDLSRFILSFPIVCHGPYITMVQGNDPHALLLLYHFYRAARILMPLDKCWWAHERALTSERALKEWLIRESAKQVHWAT